MLSFCDGVGEAVASFDFLADSGGSDVRSGGCVALAVAGFVSGSRAGGSGRFCSGSYGGWRSRTRGNGRLTSSSARSPCSRSR